MGWLQNKFEKNFMISTVDYVFNWARKSAVWPMTFGLACCAIEMIASSTARFDIARFGSEVFRPSPRQSDLMIVAGTVTLKMAPVVKRIYDQMPDPKWVISMGACSSVGGPFNTYAVLQGVDKIVPTDVYVTGCPPRPENLFYALLKLQDKIDTMTLAKRPTEVRLDPNMLENFKRQVMIAQTLQPKESGVGTGSPARPPSEARLALCTSSCRTSQSSPPNPNSRPPTRPKNSPAAIKPSA
jgi:NADH-quinone oxidoreductase subunit B